jgi:hypothetical protein
MLLLLADGTSAAVHKGDFGTSRWQLANEHISAAGVGTRYLLTALSQRGPDERSDITPLPVRRRPMDCRIKSGNDG